MYFLLKIGIFQPAMSVYQRGKSYRKWATVTHSAVLDPEIKPFKLDIFPTKHVIPEKNPPTFHYTGWLMTGSLQ